jgi:hypothetical protein
MRALRRRRSVRYDAAVNGLDDGPAGADCPEHQGDQEKQKHDEKYDLGDSHDGGGDRSTLIIWPAGSQAGGLFQQRPDQNSAGR